MYVILEIQTYADGTIGTLVYTASDYNHAQSTYHEKLAAAAISNIPVHSVVLMDSRGYSFGQEFYEHGEASA